MNRILAIQQNFEIKFYETWESAQNSNPISILEQSSGTPYTANSGNVYNTFYYKVLNGESGCFTIGTWKVYSSEQAGYGFGNFSYGLSEYQFQLRPNLTTSVLKSSPRQGIMNYFQIADCKGEIKIIRVQSLLELVHNLKQYIGFNTWAEVKLYIENQKLKMIIEELKKTQ